MCDPVTAAVVTTALAVGKTALSYVGQNQAAAANKTAANLNYARDVETASAKANQLDQQKSQNVMDSAIASLKSEGQIQASASEQGLGTQSIAQAINAGQFGIGRGSSIEDINDKNAREQLGSDLTGAEISRQSQIAKQPKGNLLSLAIGIGSDIAGGYGDYKKATA